MTLARLSIVAPLFLLVLGWSDRSVQAQDGSALRYLRSQYERFRAPRGSSPTLPDVQRVLDWETILKRALMPHWQEASAEQREACLKLVRRLMRKRFGDERRAAIETDVRFIKETTFGGGTRVDTLATLASGRTAQVTYVMERRNRRAWRIVDVIHERQSLVRRYRRQFHGVIKRDGWSGLLSRLRTRLSQKSDRTAGH